MRCDELLVNLTLPATGLESEIQKCNNQIAELMAQEELLKKYQQSLLATTKEEIYGLAGKIDVITGIWQYVRRTIPILLTHSAR